MKNEVNEVLAKKAWKAPKLTLISLSDTASKKGFGPDGGANSSWSHS